MSRYCCSGPHGNIIHVQIRCRVTYGLRQNRLVLNDEDFEKNNLGTAGRAGLRFRETQLQVARRSLSPKNDNVFTCLSVCLSVNRITHIYKRFRRSITKLYEMLDNLETNRLDFEWSWSNRFDLLISNDLNPGSRSLEVRRSKSFFCE